MNYSLYCRFVRKLVTLYALATGGGVEIASLALAEVDSDITSSELTQRVVIRRVAISPTGRDVAVLTSRGDPVSDDYEMKVLVLDLGLNSSPLVLSHYRLPSSLLTHQDTLFLLATAGQFRWSPDGNSLAVADRSSTGMRLRLFSIGQGAAKVMTLADGYDEIELPKGNSDEGGGLVFIARRVVPGPPFNDSTRLSRPPDLSLLVKDSHRFFSPLVNPKVAPSVKTQVWRYDWRLGIVMLDPREESLGTGNEGAVWPPPWWNRGSGSVRFSKEGAQRRIQAPTSISPTHIHEAGQQFEYSLADPRSAVMRSFFVVYDAMNRKKIFDEPVTNTFTYEEMLAWKDDQVLFVIETGQETSGIKELNLKNGVWRDVIREKALYRTGTEFAEAPRVYDPVTNRAVMVRETNAMPDELVMIDLTTGRVTSLYSPNDNIRHKWEPDIRFIHIGNDIGSAPLSGRLYLPSHRRPGVRYPLVFTSYASDPGFGVGVGDELPVPSLLSQGIAVFALQAVQTNITSDTSDFRFEIMRVKVPLEAMKKVASQLAKEGIVDPEKLGIQGMSYGAEIAMYALWNWPNLKAVSVASTAWTPSRFPYGGVNYARELIGRGFSDPDAGSIEGWKQLAATLNAVPWQAPLLVQGSEFEQQASAPGWVRFREAGCQVEWLIYPNEGHVKHNPANKYWVYERNLDWFRFWLKGEEDPDPAKVEQYARWRKLRELHETDLKKEEVEKARGETDKKIEIK